MRLNNYEFLDDIDKTKYLDSIPINVGLKYFGGKKFIAKYLINHILNLAICMKNRGDTPQIFVDAFTGGGKIGLSIPKGFFDKIVINDLNYGVYCYFKEIKDNPKELICAIDQISQNISKDMFYVFIHIRNNRQLEPVIAGALTYWMAYCSYNGILDPKHAYYNLTRLEENGRPLNGSLERYNIQKIKEKAHRRISRLHEIIKDYEVENLDYRELIKKYNGKEYIDVDGNAHAVPEYSKKNKLWYFDPPYHPSTVYAGNEASYLDTFDKETADEMTRILHGDLEEEYGALSYFIKSDYDPKEAFRIAKEEKDNTNNGSLKKWYEQVINMEENGHQFTTIFDCLEQDPFKKICLGEFDKGSLSGNEGELIKNSAKEFIWCRGFNEDY